MLGDLDLSLKPIRPKIHIAKANREKIAKVSEAYDTNREMSLTSLFSFKFKIPFYVEENSELVRNRNVDIIKERYHVEVAIGNKIEWYIVTKITDVMGSRGDSKEIECKYLPQELNDKKISGYSEDAKHARQVLEDILSLTKNWSIEYLDADFELTYRSFEFNDNTLLDAIYKVAETYNAIIEWDTVNRTFRMVKPELHGINRLGTISHNKYLKTLNRESDASVITTRFRPTGKDGLGIQRINPTGQGYIEDFSYFMYPFERDQDKNVIQHSYHMSDSLCNALLDFKELVSDYEGQFGNLISHRDGLVETLIQKTTELNDLKNDLAAITQIQLAQQFDEVMFFEKFEYTGSITSRTFTLKNPYRYAVMVKVGDTTGKTLTINGQSSTMSNGIWVVSRKLQTGADPTQKTTLTVTISGSGSTDVFIQVANISIQEYDTTGNETEIIEKYNFDNKEMQIASKESEIDNIDSEINSTDQDIDSIRDILSLDNNFTPAQQKELDHFVIVYDYHDDKFIEDTDLFEESRKKFDEIRIPQLAIKIDIVNFLEILEEQRNWNQLYLGDRVIIKYEIFGLKVEAKIIEMKFEYESGTVNLTIAHFKDLSTGNEQLEKFIYDSKNTTSVVDLNKSKWGKAVVDTSEFGQLFENFWDKVTNQINMALNQTVTIDEKGITITDHNDPLRFLRLTNGAMGLTRSGGLRYETAITADGLIAEMVLGKLILGQRVTIGDPDGIWMTEGPKTTITDRCGRVAMKLGLYETDPDDLFGMVINRYDPSTPCSETITNRVITNSEDGFKIQKRNGASFSDVAWLDLDGLLNVTKMQIDFMDGILSNGITIDATDGIVVTRSDIMYRSLMSGTRGFVIQQNVATPSSPSWKDIFWADLTGTVHAQDLRIANSFITDGGIEGAYIILRDGIGGVMKLYPSEGLWAGSENSANAPAWIKPDGTAIFKKLLITDGDNTLLIDSENKKLYLDNFDIIGAGQIEAEYILTNTVLASDGFIANLAVNRLITLSQNDTVGSIADFIHIENQKIMLKTGSVVDRVQAESHNGDLLYWTDASKTGVTNKPTPYPMWNLSIIDQDKLVIGFETGGGNAAPYIEMGAGDGVLPESGKAFISKPNAMWTFIYNRSNNSHERRLLFKDDSLELSTESGTLDIKHDNGCSIKILNNGNIEINATGQINVSGAMYNFS